MSGASLPSRELFRRLIGESARRATAIVVAAPVFEFVRQVRQVEKDLDVEKLVTQSSVEACDEGVLHWPARCDERQLDARSFAARFRNVGLEFVADKYDLLRGESTTSHVTLFGLAWINGPAFLGLVNTTPGVITFMPQNTQLITVQPADVAADGSAKFDRGLTGIRRGSQPLTLTRRIVTALSRADSRVKLANHGRPG